ncbi:MAG: hypothetical protein HKN11_17525 [Rhizobiales bacterium]|nr:hypothetical protein [Hyphomicrobiales bacterium]
MNWKVLAATFGTLAMMAGTANALTLTNNDEVEYGLEVILGEGGADLQTLQLPGGQSLTDICDQGCTIKLPNGAEQEFEGDENVTIQDGEFMIAE